MKRLVLYGAGEEGKKWLKKLGRSKVFRFADSDPSKIGKTIDGVQCCSIHELIAQKNEINIFLAVSRKYVDEVRILLDANGLKDREINTPYPSETVRVRKGGWVSADSVFEGNNYVDTECAVACSYMGYSSYVARGTELCNVKVGRYSTIGPKVSIITGQHPTRKFVSVHPAFYSPSHEVTNIHYCSEPLFEEYRYTKNGFAAEIGNDVWIGTEVRIMEGVTIGDGAVIAAGAIVTKDIPAYTVAGGIPAGMIRERFSQEEKSFLEKLQWWDKPEEWIQKYSIYFSDVKSLMNALCTE